MEGGALPDLENWGGWRCRWASRTWTDVANMMMVVRVIMITMIIIFMTITKV